MNVDVRGGAGFGAIGEMQTINRMKASAMIARDIHPKDDLA